MVERVRPGVVRIETNAGSGSGIIVEVGARDNSALVLTNYHVIQEASRINVVVNDSVSYPATIIGIDSTRDLAVLNICCGSFKALPLGDADSIRVGSEVIAVGYPLNIPGSATVTRGIVSAVRYENDKARWVLQVDASINPGNSGGPLFSPSGEVVGINTFVIRQSIAGVSVEGINFAVSAETVQAQIPVLKQGTVLAFSTPTPGPTLRTYYNGEYRYQIDVPVGWSINDSAPDSVHIQSVDSSAFIGIFTLDTFGNSLREIADSVFEFRSNQPSILFEPLGRYMDNSAAPTVIVEEYRVQGATEFCIEHVSDLVLRVGSQVMELYVSACEDAYNQHSTTLVDMVASLRSR
jgi:hypothetical protein